MKNKIITAEEAVQVTNRLHTEGKRIVVTGGCFDIIHAGHILFLKKAKEQGDSLMVLLESDKKITELKGPHRPINTQKDRALILSSITYTDYIVMLSNIQNDEDYDDMISRLKPAIIATTENDPNRYHKERQSRTVDAKVVDVVKYIQNKSTSKIAELLKKEL